MPLKAFRSSLKALGLPKEAFRCPLKTSRYLHIPPNWLPDAPQMTPRYQKIASRYLAANLGCLEANLGCLEATLGRLEANLGRLEANLGRLEAKPGRFTLFLNNTNTNAILLSIGTIPIQYNTMQYLSVLTTIHPNIRMSTV